MGLPTRPGACATCGGPLDGVGRCPRCRPSPAPTTGSCPYCSTIITTGDYFCRHCGEKLVNWAPNPRYLTSGRHPSNPSLKPIIWIGWVLLLLPVFLIKAAGAAWTNLTLVMSLGAMGIGLWLLTKKATRAGVWLLCVGIGNVLFLLFIQTLLSLIPGFTGSGLDSPLPFGN
jgi:hypothetical protein